MRLFNTIVVFSVAITVQKRGDCSLAHTIVHIADMTNYFSCTKRLRCHQYPLLIRFSTGDFYHFFKNAVGLNVVKFKGWGIGWSVVLGLTAL